MKNFTVVFTEEELSGIFDLIQAELSYIDREDVDGGEKDNAGVLESALEALRNGQPTIA